MDIVTQILSNTYTDEQLKKYQTGNVEVSKNADGSLTFTAQKGTTNESKVTYTKEELRGLGIQSINKDSDGNCIVTYTDNTTKNLGSFKGDKGDIGDKGDKGDKGDTGLGIDSIDVKESSLDNGENIFTITLTDGTSKSFKVLNGSKGSKGDTGISLDDVKLVKDITDKTNHLQVKFDNETSYTDLGRVQGKSNYEIALDNGFVGNEDEYLKSLTAQATESKIVTSKPRIEDDTTALGVWYYWQDNKEGTTDTAYKYRLDIPSTQDLGHGKYCFYYNLKWFTSETTQDVNALTNKDTYKYYLVMNLLDVSFDIIQETIADGTTTVLEHVTGSVSTTAPTSEYTPISSNTLSMLGVQCQTLYIGATKETANEVTIRTGTDVKGFITSDSFQSIIGNKSDLSTLNNDNIVSAINEVKSGLDEHTNDSDIHTSATEKASYVKKTDIVDNLTSTDTDKPLSANQGRLLKSMIVTLTGVVLPYAGSSVPTGFLLCNGQAVSRTEYLDLFSVIGTTYGEGDGSTTFNLPNLQNKFIQGTGTNAVGTEMSAGLPNITGEVGYLKAAQASSYYNGINTKTGCFTNSTEVLTDPHATKLVSSNTQDDTGETGLIVFNASSSNSIYGNSNTVQPPAVVMNYIIKY